MKKIISIALTIIPLMIFAQEAKEINADCKPVLPNVKHFCGDVGSKTPYKGSDGNFDFIFQQVMYESACADIENMSDKEINKKIREWWDLYKDKLVCDSMQFNVTNGSILKYAVNGGVTAFIDDAIYSKIDLNFVDKADNRTVLDYTRDELKKHGEDSAIGKTLQEYYTKLKNAGAKHRSEL